MTTATRETQKEANDADTAINAFETDDLVPWKQEATLAAQQLGRSATEAVSSLRSDLNRKLQSAKGETTLAGANLAKDTEQFLAAKKALITEDDQKTRTQFSLITEDDQKTRTQF